MVRLVRRLIRMGNHRILTYGGFWPKYIRQKHPADQGSTEPEPGETRRRCRFGPVIHRRNREGRAHLSLSTILSLASVLRVPPTRLFEGIGQATPVPDSPGGIMAADTKDGLAIRFRYDQFDATYNLAGATRAQFDELIDVMRVGLADARARSNAVSRSFLHAVRVWHDANPSDLWTFLINRAYCDRSNHPEANVRLNLEQSWKRTSGWALERVMVEHYGPFLNKHGIAIKTSSKSEKASFLGTITDPRVLPDKADVLMLYRSRGSERLLGVIHVKASIAERRTDDVPMSQALIEAGYLSVFWTMDSKSFPSSNPTNRREFGDLAEDDVNDKRRDFEEHGHFSACFSYNKNTVPTQEDSDAAARIFVCDFTSPDDRFSQFLIDEARRRISH